MERSACRYNVGLMGFMHISRQLTSTVKRSACHYNAGMMSFLQISRHTHLSMRRTTTTGYIITAWLSLLSSDASPLASASEVLLVAGAAAGAKPEPLPCFDAVCPVRSRKSAKRVLYTKLGSWLMDSSWAVRRCSASTWWLGGAGDDAVCKARQCWLGRREGGLVVCARVGVGAVSRGYRVLQRFDDAGLQGLEGSAGVGCAVCRDTWCCLQK